MANTTNTQPVAVTPATPARAADKSKAVVATVAAWLIPGAGHFVLRRWIRGTLLLAAVSTMFFLGLGMEGKVYAFNTGDLLDILGFFGDVGSGVLYFLARNMDWGHGAIHRATADYGTKFIIVAGLLNIISAADAYHIATGKKQ
ncbi:MAG TPA: DUF6677 family protein [Clostridia bacterium]|nr:DUF6677 family protein [Clostridia bacterium]